MELDHRYIIGIDLGTTNSALAYVDLQKEAAGRRNRPIKRFKIQQLTGYGEVSRHPVLPSFLYIPGDYDISREAISHPWDHPGDHFAGVLARDHGAKVPARLVSSAKSWLCHATVDKTARMLPWGSDDDVYKVSPVQATAAYLTHLKKAWNHDRGEDEEQHMENQLVILTVPASFDEIARDLTVKAAAMAGLSRVILLEEPLAAFYDWLNRHFNDWSQRVNPGELILVCDVGGGTTDFTLITLRAVEGSPRFERIAVGDHLILGGDNVDLALARHMEGQMGRQSNSLSGDRWKALCHQCRRAKERILDGRSTSEKITVMGEGSRLIGGTLSATLDRSTLEKIVLEGFFPLVEPESDGQGTRRKGITEFGLPYESEPAITRQLGWFLGKHRGEIQRLLEKNQAVPDWILFNGGSLKPAIVQEQIRSSVRRWFSIKDHGVPGVLENPNPDLAVSLGAAYYGLVKIGRGVRVGSGSPRAYYLGVGRLEEAAAESGPKQAICLVERGLDEGSRIDLRRYAFEVRANERVSFDIYSSSFRSGDRCGDLVAIDDTLTALPPIKTVVQYGKKGAKTRLPVQIEADYTEIGTLALWCRSRVSDHRWQLQFQLRSNDVAGQVSESEVFDNSLVAQIRDTLSSVFSDTRNNQGIQNLVKTLSSAVGKPKEKWPLGLIRTLADDVLKKPAARKIAPDFESRWLNLAGFFLRPGFGDGFDSQRVKQLWKIYPHGPLHAKNPQVRLEWWILWRRVAAGLKPGQQRQFLQDLAPLLVAGKMRKGRRAPQEKLEMWMAASSMEQLLVKDKIKLGRALLAEIHPKKAKPQQFWALSRLGARSLLYGPDDRVIPPVEASAWIGFILDRQWRNPMPAAAALAQLARRTGDRARDIDSRLVVGVIDWMGDQRCGSRHIRLVEEQIELEKQEENALFGDTLPAGIVLKSA